MLFRVAHRLGLLAFVIVATMTGAALAWPQQCCHTEPPPSDCCAHAGHEHADDGCPCCDHVDSDTLADALPGATSTTVSASAAPIARATTLVDPAARPRSELSPPLPRARSSPTYLLLSSLLI